MQPLVARCPPTTLGLGERSHAMDPRHADWEININCLHLETCWGPLWPRERSPQYFKAHEAAIRVVHRAAIYKNSLLTYNLYLQRRQGRIGKSSLVTRVLSFMLVTDLTRLY